MQTITLTEAHKKLELLTGTWAGEETCHPSPWTPSSCRPWAAPAAASRWTASP